MILRRPEKYNPEKREFVLTKNNLSALDNVQPGGYPGNYGAMSSASEIFENQSDISQTDSMASYGNRVSQFGFTDYFG